MTDSGQQVVQHANLEVIWRRAQGLGRQHRTGCACVLGHRLTRVDEQGLHQGARGTERIADSAVCSIAVGAPKCSIL